MWFDTLITSKGGRCLLQCGSTTGLFGALRIWKYWLAIPISPSVIGKMPDRIEAVYFAAVYNPETGGIGGLADSEREAARLYAVSFPWVNGLAHMRWGLVLPEKGKAILQVLLAKLESIVAFHSYQLGLPTNLLPMSPDDYFPHTSGAPKRADGMDSWQVYMNGGATPASNTMLSRLLYQSRSI